MNKMPKWCAVPDCKRRTHTMGICSTHYLQFRKGNKAIEPYMTRYKREPGTGNIRSDGYIYIGTNGTNILEHRKIMEERLGRKLLTKEQVHHKNEIKSDNSPSNLELMPNQQTHANVHKKKRHENN